MVIYLDDIAVYSNNMEDHVEHLLQDVQSLDGRRQGGGNSKLRGSNESTRVAILSWPHHYHRCFIFSYSTIAFPLTDLLKKNCELEWTDTCQTAFEKLKAAVTEEPSLALPYFTKAFEVHTDASDFAVADILMQE
uniref:Reverse transcriptase/retrotransposon-derived protein RNase H-like domain-containing protein n=1 Tax=Solanum lycopersicum TaxID=4081 RepID=A0A3Q7GP13_SOLLC